MNFRQYQFDGTRLKALPWYWSLGLGILAAVILGFVAVAALIGGVILATGFLVYKAATLVSRFAQGLGKGEPDAAQDLVVRNEAAKRRTQAQLEVIDVEVEEMPDQSDR